MSEQELWHYWNSVASFRLYEGFFLQKGVLPPKEIQYLDAEQQHDWYHEIATVVKYRYADLLAFVERNTEGK